MRWSSTGLWLRTTFTPPTWLVATSCRSIRTASDTYVTSRQDEALPEIEQIDFSQDWRQFVKEKFYLERQWTDYPGLLAFRSRVLAYVAYYSPAASLLHKILYLFRQPFYNYKSPDTTLDPTDRSLSQPVKVRCVTVRD